ncbi:hypothetical protein ABZ832_07380 [Streptantibioticus parmotrematis]|uniref:hypothetical protein n=1 Tax=Streptantibioticus parmotrematis TaxID=2873249 RepID=UPI0033EC65E9
MRSGRYGARAESVDCERVLAQLAAGRPFAEVLEDEDAAIQVLRVREVIEALPWVDAIHATQVMREFGIAERRRVGGLTRQQRHRLGQLLSPTATA